MLKNSSAIEDRGDFGDGPTIPRTVDPLRVGIPTLAIPQIFWREIEFLLECDWERGIADGILKGESRERIRGMERLGEPCTLWDA